MTRGRLLVGLLALWLLGLAVVLQPQRHPVPPVFHAHPLDRADRDLPTLPPVGP